MSDSTPTEKFETPVAAAPEAEPDDAKSRKLLYILIGIGALVLIALIILIATIAGDGEPNEPGALPAATDSASASPTPDASESPSPTPDPDETEAAPPPPAEATGARFTSFSVTSPLAGCSRGGPGFDSTYPPIQVSWATAGADEAWIVTGTSDAADSMFMRIPLNGDQSDFEYPILLGCSGEPTTFTITLVAPDGSHVQKHFTVTSSGEVF